MFALQTTSSGTSLDSLLACRVSRKEMSVLIKRALCKEFLAFYVTVTKLALNRFGLILVKKDFRGLQFFKNLYSGSRVVWA